MESRLGYKEPVSDQAQVPGTIEAGLEGRAAKQPIRSMFARARDGADRVLLQVERSDQMVSSVGDIQGVTCQCHSLRVIKGGLVEGPVLFARFADSGDRDLLTVQVRNNYAVVGTVGDKEAPTRFVRQDFSGEKQGAGAFFLEPG